MEFDRVDCLAELRQRRDYAVVRRLCLLCRAEYGHELPPIENFSVSEFGCMEKTDGSYSAWKLCQPYRRTAYRICQKMELSCQFIYQGACHILGRSLRSTSDKLGFELSVARVDLRRCHSTLPKRTRRPLVFGSTSVFCSGTGFSASGRRSRYFLTASNLPSSTGACSEDSLRFFCLCKSSISHQLHQNQPSVIITYVS